jgi:hypothetical protein
MFSALDLQNDPQAAATHPDWKANIGILLSRTSHAYFMANQVRLLELANLELEYLDDTNNVNLITHLKYWCGLRFRAQQPSPQIVAWSDPGDLLTWGVPDLSQSHVTVQNCPAQNAVRWFWLLENPISAHTKYDQNERVLRAMVPKTNHRPTKDVNGTKAAVSVCP